MNNNAKIGKNVEILFKNFVLGNNDLIEKIRSSFKISGEFLTAINGGAHNEKVDVKMEFACGRNIDANIKAFKKTIAYNQLTRASLSNFCNRFDLDCLNFLQELFIQKAKNINKKLIPDHKQAEVFAIFQPIAKELVKWSISHKKAREILVLYERSDNIVNIYSMNDVLKYLDYNVTFTKFGNIAIGKSIIIQRKGGNGVHIHGIIDKGDLNHPGNNIQLKLKINDFLKEMEKYKLGQYYL